MYRTPSVFGPLHSGFVPFASGAPMDDVAEAEAGAVVARAAAPSAAPLAAPRAEPIADAPPAAWAPASSARIRGVEMAVIAAICGYFGFSLLSTLAGF